MGRRLRVLAGVTASVVMALAAVAHACVPQATIGFDPGGGPPSGSNPGGGSPGEEVEGGGYAPGARVTGRGRGFTPALRFELRLHHQSGELLWSGTPDASGEVDFSFAAPNTRPGYHVVVASQSGRQGDPARAILRIAAPEPSQPPPAGAAPGEERGGRADQRPGRAAVHQRPGRAAVQQQPRVAGEQRGAPAGQQRGGAPTARGQSSEREKSARRANAQARRTASREPEVFGGAMPAVRRSTAPANTVPSTSGEMSATGPSERSATGDLWSGFGAGGKQSLVPSGSDPKASTNGAELAVGTALVGVGSVLLLIASFGFAQARRRRAYVGAPGRRLGE